MQDRESLFFTFCQTKLLHIVCEQNSLVTFYLRWMEWLLRKRVFVIPLISMVRRILSFYVVVEISGVVLWKRVFVNPLVSMVRRECSFFFKNKVRD